MTNPWDLALALLIGLGIAGYFYGWIHAWNCPGRHWNEDAHRLLRMHLAELRQPVEERRSGLENKEMFDRIKMLVRLVGDRKLDLYWLDLLLIASAGIRDQTTRDAMNQMEERSAWLVQKARRCPVKFLPHHRITS